MTIVQVIDVSIVFNASVFTLRAVLVIMIFVCMAHRILRDEGGEMCSLHSELGQESSIACMTPLVTSRAICPSAKL